ncbi:Bicyclomycin resistance protein [bioreactor metagenome]|uniref:Bicyclomycin resistance protein n=1 Tax=bioreactor metagenome TaxID=1076179 RepID=A0A644Y4U9_9ZZZZ
MGQVKQKFLGSKGLILLIAMLSAFVPLSTDLYLPALPGMSVYFGVDAGRINLTISLFFIFYALGTLIWGPLSDRLGRRTVLLVGLSIYLVASAFCASAKTVEVLMAFRVLQAIGGSAAGAVATAIVKDVYSGKQRQSVLAIVQSMVTISPAVAPVLGAFLLKVMSWRGVFWTLMGIGILALIGALLFEETLLERNPGRLHQSFARMGVVLQNKRFTLLLLLFSLTSVASLAFITSSTYIYQDNFHLSSQVYSFYFSVNALGMTVAPMLYLWLAKRADTQKIIYICFGTAALSGLMICLFGNTQPWIFALCILPSTLANSCIRPPSVNLMLDQQKGDSGSVSSLIGCSSLLMGSLGMQLMSLPWQNAILAIGILTLGIAAFSFIVWPLLHNYVAKHAAETRPETTSF